MKRHTAAPYAALPVYLLLAAASVTSFPKAAAASVVPAADVAAAPNIAMSRIAVAAQRLPSVTVAATAPSAAIGGSATGLITFSRTGNTANSLTVSFSLSGTAVKWTDYYRLPQGDMPESVTIPAGSA